MDSRQLLPTFDPCMLEKSDYLKGLLKGNYQLSEAEQAGIEEQMAILQAQIGPYEVLMVSMKEALSWRTAVVAPERRLPSDVLAIIFTVCASEHQDIFSCKCEYTFGKTPIHIPSTQALAISQVCSRWRTIALSTPKLWSKIEMNMRSMYHDIPWALRKDPDALYIRRLEEWVRRAAPLNIDLRVSEFDSHTITAFRKALVHLAHRWEAIRIDCPDGIDLSDTKLPPTFPALQTFSVRGYHSSWLQLSAPNLRTVDTRKAGGLAILWNSPGLPWQELTSLTLDIYFEYTADQFFLQLRTIQSASQTLEELKLNPSSDADFITSNEVAETKLVPVRFPKLRRLVLGGWSGPELDLIEAPRLAELHLAPWMKREARWECIARLLMRSSARVEWLILDLRRVAGISFSTMKDLLRTLHATTRFKLIWKEASHAEQLLSLLQLAPGNTPLLPLVTEINLEGSLGGSSVDSVMRALNSRIGHSSAESPRISSITFREIKGHASRSTIEGWRKKGAKVCIFPA